jgi:hypothetical protein
LNKEVNKLDMAVVKSLISVDESSFRNSEIKATREIGTFSILLAPIRLGPDAGQQVSGALIWATSSDGKTDMLVTVRAFPAVDAIELEEISRALRLR